MTIVGEASVLVRPDTSSFEKGLTDGASRAAGGIGKAFAPLHSVVSTALNASGVQSQFSEIIEHVSGAVESLSGEGRRIGTVLSGVGVAAAGVGLALQAEGSKDKAAQQQLSQSITDTGNSYADFKDEIEKTISSQEKFGHNAVDTQNALQALTQATGDPKKALDTMGVAANLAAARHESLTAASSQLALILEGKGTRTLAAFGITMGKTASGSKDTQGAIDQLAAKLRGQAAAASDTFSGKLDGLKAHLSDVAAKVGNDLGPALTAIGPVLATAGGIMELFAARARAAALATEEAGVAEEGTSIITRAYTAVQAAFNVVMDANPVVLVVVAIAALAAGFYELYTHCKPFRDIINEIGSFLRTVFLDALHGLEAGIDEVKGTVLTLINIALLPLRVVFAVMQGEIKFFVDLFTGHFDRLGGDIEGVVGKIVGLLRNAFGGALSALVGAAQSALSSVGSFFAGLPGTILGFIGDIGAKFLNIGHDIVWGIIHGLENSAGDLAKAAGNLVASAIPGPIKHILGIGSPSKVTAEFGRNVVQGLVAGIADSTEVGRLSGASGDLGGKVAANLAVGLSAAGTGRPAGAAGQPLSEGTGARLLGALERILAAVQSNPGQLAGALNSTSRAASLLGRAVGTA